MVREAMVGQRGRGGTEGASRAVPMTSSLEELGLQLCEQSLRNQREF